MLGSIAAGSLLLGGKASAVPVGFSGTLSLTNSTLPPLSDGGTGVAEVTFVGTEIGDVQIPAGIFSIQSSGFLPINDPGSPVTGAGWNVDVSQDAGGFSGLSSASPAGTVPLVGTLGETIELFNGAASIDLTIDASVIGTNRVDTYPAGLMGTAQVVGAPWSVATRSGNQVYLTAIGSVSFSSVPLPAPFGAALNLLFDIDPNQGFGFGPGAPVEASLLGGSSSPGGVDISLGEVVEEGIFEASFEVTTQDAIEDLLGALPFELPNGSSANLWNLDAGGAFSGLAEVTFGYDDGTLLPGFDETRLAIFHLEGGSWVELLGTVDPTANTITASTSSFSPFVLGVTAVPEPGTALLFGGGLALVAAARRSVRSSRHD
jgi:hypothetical protein